MLDRQWMSDYQAKRENEDREWRERQEEKQRLWQEKQSRKRLGWEIFVFGGIVTAIITIVTIVAAFIERGYFW